MPDYSPDPSAGSSSNRWALEAKNQTGALPDCFSPINPCLVLCSFETFLRPVGGSLDYHHLSSPTITTERHSKPLFHRSLCSAFSLFISCSSVRLLRIVLLPLFSLFVCSLLEATISYYQLPFQTRTLLRVAHMIALQNPALLPSAKVDISLLLKPQDEEENSPPGTTTTALPSRVVPTGPVLPPMLVASSPVSGPSVPPPSISKIPASVPAKRLQPAHTAESPAKKQSKWSPEEDALIIELRGSGMKWEDISKRLPGRSAISCRLHYQNYLERRSEWDEDKKNKLARLYERYVLQKGH